MARRLLPLKSLLKPVAWKRKTTAFLSLLIVTCTLLPLTAPVRWTEESILRVLFPEQNPETPIYRDSSITTLDLSDFIKDAREAWPDASVAIVHAAAFEVAKGLLHHSEVQVGSLEDGTFTSWELAPWKAAKRIKHELAIEKTYMAHQGRYVFCISKAGMIESDQQ